MERHRQPNKIIIIAIALGLVFVASIVAAVIAQQTSQKADETKKDTIYISNIDDCSSNLETTILTTIRARAFDLVTYANKYNNVSSLSNYQSSIRSGSCHTKVVTGDVNTAANVKSTSIIVDIPQAKQSWEFTYNWVTNGTNTDGVDLGAVTPSCVPAAQLIYGDFNCDKILNQLTYGTPIVDPILQYMPYSGAGFALTYDPTTKQVTAQIQVLQEDVNNQALITNLKGQVVYWFQHNNLNINNYTIIYKTVVVPVSVD